MKPNPSSKTILIVASLLSILFLFAGMGCAKKATHPAESKAARISKIWVIYAEGYGGTNEYMMPKRSRLIKQSIDGHRREILGDFLGKVDDMALSPVGGKLAFTAEGKLKILDLKGKRIIAEISHKSKTTFINAKGEKTGDHACACEYEEVYTPLWSPDGTTLAFMRKHYGLGVNWATLDTLDLRTMHPSQTAPDYDNFMAARLQAWVPGTNSIIIEVPENKYARIHTSQSLAVIDLGTYKVKDIVKNERFMGLWQGGRFVSYRQVQLPARGTGAQWKTHASVRNFDESGVQDEQRSQALSKYLGDTIWFATAANGDIFYTDSYASGKTTVSETSFTGGKETAIRKIPIYDRSRVWRIDSSLRGRTRIAEEQGHFVWDLAASKDGAYLVYYRRLFGNPYSSNVFDVFSQQLAACNAKTGKITVLSGPSGQVPIGQQRATFIPGTPFVLYTEE